MAASTSRSYSDVVAGNANNNDDDDGDGMEAGMEDKTTADIDPSTFSKTALATVVSAIKRSKELPFDGDDFDYYSSFKGFRSTVGLESKRMRRLMERILLQQGLKVNLANLELDEIFDVIIEANDSILERVSTAIDEACGLCKKIDPVILTTVQKRLDINTSWNRKSGGTGNSNSDSAATYRLLAGRNVQRPQLKFRDKIDNTNDPFVPIIREKPNALKQLAIVLEPTEYGEMFSHPYQCELDHFKVSEDHLNMAMPQKPKPIEDTPLVFVDTVSKLRQLNSVLKTQTEFAVDLEHHSYRSFQGITCLMQVSTRDCDYIVDTLELRSELQPLNESFTDPRIVKIFHGADKDVEWLQRDLGLYLVNMFDTGQAARVLGVAGFSLAFLLKSLCDVDADKQYQLADWRIRPLPEPMTRYAREDTHYLPYIYDCMKNDLLAKGNAEKNLLLSVFQRSKLLCEKRYVKPVFHSEAYMELYKKSRKVFNARQLYALRELYKWRDATARAEDECTGYVLSNHMLLQIAEVLPREQQGILACCNPIPTLVRQNLTDIHLAIIRAREQSLVGTVKRDLQIEVDVRRHQVDLDNVLHCPHDLRQYQDSGSVDDEPTILELWNKHGDDFQCDLVAAKRASLKEVAQLSAIVTNAAPNPKRSEGFNVDAAFRSYCSPYQRYALIRTALSQMTSESSTSSGKGRVESNLVENVRKHFVELVRVYGDAEKAPKEEVEEEKAAAAATEVVNRKSPSEVDVIRSEEIVEPIRKKKASKEAASNKATRKTKNKKRKLEATAVQEQHRKKVADCEAPSTETKTSVPDVEEASPKTTAGAAASTKKGKKKKKRTGNVASLVTNDATSFRPFDYAGANFEAFKGGSTIKDQECFDPNGGAPKNKKAKRFKNKQRRPEKSGSTYTSTAKSNRSSKSSWPKL